jgi:hypothetical protein
MNSTSRRFAALGIALAALAACTAPSSHAPKAPPGLDSAEVYNGPGQPADAQRVAPTSLTPRATPPASAPPAMIHGVQTRPAELKPDPALISDAGIRDLRVSASRGEVGGAVNKLSWWARARGWRSRYRAPVHLFCVGALSGSALRDETTGSRCVHRGGVGRCGVFRPVPTSLPTCGARRAPTQKGGRARDSVTSTPLRAPPRSLFVSPVGRAAVWGGAPVGRARGAPSCLLPEAHRASSRRGRRRRSSTPRQTGGPGFGACRS